MSHWGICFPYCRLDNTTYEVVKLIAGIPHSQIMEHRPRGTLRVREVVFVKSILYQDIVNCWEIECRLFQTGGAGIISEISGIMASRLFSLGGLVKGFTARW